ncbi:MAG: hypothetical protein K2X66_13395 [Cyanobacteria bacterium]|nr:hypothetical protein [Cyanobacteriota bacterium]
MSFHSFQSSQPMVSGFFQQALKDQKLAHAYVFKGRNTQEMYDFALELAKALNCETLNPSNESNQNPLDKALEPCNHCRHCLWINKNSHPSILTVSRLTFLVSESGEALDEEGLQKLQKKKTQQTQIKAEQINRLLSVLSYSSKEQRMVIFVDAEEHGAGGQKSEECRLDFKENNDNFGFYEPKFPPPLDWAQVNLSKSEGKVDSQNVKHPDKKLLMKPLHSKLFNATSANRFLKTLEEPPVHTTFIFITDSEQNLLETIVSRCQVIPFHSHIYAVANELKPERQFFYQKLLTQLENRGDVFSVLENFEQELSEVWDETPIQALDSLQIYLREKFAHETPTLESVRAYSKIQKVIEQSKSKLIAKTNPSSTMNHLFFQVEELLSGQSI